MLRAKGGKTQRAAAEALLRRRPEWLFGVGTLSSNRPMRRKSGESGYILLAVLVMVFFVTLMLALAAPKVVADLERDREVELMHRGMQYRRAVQLYYRKFGKYPPNIDALEKTNELRFLRRRYVDPITGKDEWHLIHFGENKLPTVYGFFGQPMAGAGSTLAGTGPGGVGQSLGAVTPSSFGGNPAGGQPGGGFVAGNGSLAGANPSAGQVGGNAGTNGDPNAANGQNAGDGAGGTGSGGSSLLGGSANGQTFGGGGIIGVESTSLKPTILEYHKKKHFNEWEFVYDPASERLAIGGNAGSIGTPAGQAGNSPGSIGNQPPGNQPSPWSPNGNLPVPTQPEPPQGGQPWSPNGNLPLPPGSPQQ